MGNQWFECAMTMSYMPVLGEEQEVTIIGKGSDVKQAIKDAVTRCLKYCKDERRVPLSFMILKIRNYDCVSLGGEPEKFDTTYYDLTDDDIRERL